MTRYIGYHGTTAESAKSILADNHFNPSTKMDEWLGDGVYFFENDYLQAYDFITRARKKEDVKVLKAEIESDNVLDLTLKEVQVLINEFRLSIIERLKDEFQGQNKNKLQNGVIINKLCDTSEEKIDVVRGVFFTPPVQRTIPNTNIPCVQTQLCVRNQGCILIVEEANSNDRY